MCGPLTAGERPLLQATTPLHYSMRLYNSCADDSYSYTRTKMVSELCLWSSERMIGGWTHHWRTDCMKDVFCGWQGARAMQANIEASGVVRAEIQMMLQG